MKLFIVLENGKLVYCQGNIFLRDEKPGYEIVKTEFDYFKVSRQVDDLMEYIGQVLQDVLLALEINEKGKSLFLYVKKQDENKIKEIEKKLFEKFPEDLKDIVKENKKKYISLNISNLFCKYQQN